VVEKVPGWLERLLLPRLSEMSGEIKALNTRIDGLEKIIVSLRNEMESRFGAVDQQMGSLRSEMNVRFDSIEKRMPLMEKLMELEVRLAKVEAGK